MSDISVLLKQQAPLVISGDIPHGDMPGDSLFVGQDYIDKAATVYGALKDKLFEKLKANPHTRAVIGVSGGSGSGKTVVASVLGYHLNSLGIGTYILSGDNYPRRIPEDNDAERLHLFRVGGLRGLLSSGLYTDDMSATLREMWEADADSEPDQAEKYPWMAIYQRAGRMALTDYLGTPNEIDFAELSGILSRFKNGENSIPLKRMGRVETALWYDTVDFSNTQVLIVEWTHANSDFLQGVDLPVFLNSTPMQTLEHRRMRNRDAATDSAFTTMVLEIEQHKLDAQAWKAEVILSREGKLLSYQDYRREMA